MKSIFKNSLSIVVIFLFLLILSSFSVSAIDISVANSEDWVDVYSVMLYSKFNEFRPLFANSESLLGLTRILSKDNSLTIFESSKSPFIKNLGNQLEASDYNVAGSITEKNFNLELDINSGNYYVISRDNPRISLSLASLAIKNNYWVLVVDDDSISSIARKLRSAENVVAVGNFRRDFLEDIEESVDKWINNNDLFKDSQELAKEFGLTKTIVLADGSFLELEFFETENPVLLSGSNKILDDTFNFLSSNNIEGVVIIGNELAVVGEQIRTKSNKEISVFVKFGQSGTDTSEGKVYALSLFELPQQTIGVTVDKVSYDPVKEELLAYYRNTGNSGVYELTTLSIKDNGVELGSASDSDIVFLGAGEYLPIKYDVSINLEEITESTRVEFYTSFGLYPSQLDNFLTMENKYGPPFSIPLTIEEIQDDGSLINITNVAYYKNLKRIGVEITNLGDVATHYNVKVRDLIVNGLEQDLFKEDKINSGETQITYIPVELDKVDLEENRVFKITLAYGTDKDLLLKTLMPEEIPFKIIKGISTTLIIIVVVILVIIIMIIFLLKSKNNTHTKRKQTKKRKKRR